MEATFTTTIDHVLDYPVEAHITYQAKTAYKPTRYGEKKCHEIEVTDTKYTSFGVEVHVEGKTWQRLEWIAQERAEEHFSEAA